MKLTMHDGTTLYTTEHAEMRWLERGGPVESMVREMEAAVQYGAQFGDGQMWLTPCGLVLVQNADKVISTVLTQSQAIGNMQVYGLHPKSLPAAPTLVGDGLSKAERRRANRAEEAERAARKKAERRAKVLAQRGYKKPLALIAVEEVLGMDICEPYQSVKNRARERAATEGYDVNDQLAIYISAAVESAMLMKRKIEEGLVARAMQEQSA